MDINFLNQGVRAVTAEHEYATIALELAYNEFYQKYGQPDVTRVVYVIVFRNDKWRASLHEIPAASSLGASEQSSSVR